MDPAQFIQMAKDVPSEELQQVTKTLEYLKQTVEMCEFIHEKLDAEAGGNVITLFNAVVKRRFILMTSDDLLKMKQQDLISADQFRAYGSALAQNLMDLAKAEGMAADGISGGIARLLIKNKEMKDKVAFSDLAEHAAKRNEGAAQELKSVEPKKSTE